MSVFYKYQGTGNDFIMLDDRTGKFPKNNTDYIAGLCHRRFGIGADGLILLQTGADGMFYMQYFNSDGNESSMCGNGGRCFAQFIFDLGLAKDEVKFMAIDGLHVAKQLLDSSSKIALQMIPVNEISVLGSNTFELNTGSPHYVQFLAEPISSLSIVEEARKIRYNETYEKQGINVNFLNLKGLKELDIRTYERGVEDETLSCGTGATAAALSAAVLNQLPAGKHEIQVQVMGGNLSVKFHFHTENKQFDDIWLIGPAVRVFEGNI